jgi:hypothetical protein
MVSGIGKQIFRYPLPRNDGNAQPFPLHRRKYRNTRIGADLRVCPNNSEKSDNTVSQIPDNTVSGKSDNIVSEKSDNIVSGNIEGEHVGSPLHRVVQWFKTMTTNEYIRGVKTLGWQPFNGKLWQRNYWEHIIRNEQSYQTISEYIINNPSKWNDDKFNKI